MLEIQRKMAIMTKEVLIVPVMLNSEVEVVVTIPLEQKPVSGVLDDIDRAAAMKEGWDRVGSVSLNFPEFECFEVVDEAGGWVLAGGKDVGLDLDADIDELKKHGISEKIVDAMESHGACVVPYSDVTKFRKINTAGSAMVEVSGQRPWIMIGDDYSPFPLDVLYLFRLGDVEDVDNVRSAFAGLARCAPGLALDWLEEGDRKKVALLDESSLAELLNSEYREIRVRAVQLVGAQSVIRGA